MRANVHSIGLAGTTNLSLLAPVREGLAPGFEPISYLERLRRLLSAMHASRRNARESELRGSVFPDPIGRFGIIGHFRYALVPPSLAGASRWHLSLNVGFDGGWEPYMRVIYRDIGPLLDALLCHCDGYRGSRTVDFDNYSRWVRNAETDAGIYYTDSAATIADQRYLASVERLQRDNHDPEAADLAVALHAEADDATAMAQGLFKAGQDPGKYLPLHLRTLKGLYRLTGFWADADGDVLLRFAQLVLGGFRQVISKLPNPPTDPEVKQVVTLFADELAWLGRALDEPRQEERLSWDASQLQGALLPDASRATHGALVLLKVTDVPDALAHLSSLAGACADKAAVEGEARYHVALTMAGMRALQIHPKRLASLPTEFLEGMEQRAGVLGDVRANHPDHWHRPLRHGTNPTGEDRIDLSVVHVAVMLRTIDVTPGHELHPLLAAEVTALGAPHTGLTVLAVEPTRSRTATPGGRDHFGFVDGISQPIVVEGRMPDPEQSEVRPGELVLGFGNDRGDGPLPIEADGLLDQGSFLVVRKLRQRLDHLDAAVTANGMDRTELLERMVGRRQDGEPLVHHQGGQNDFDFRGADGLQCPFASHVRRVNPRDGRPAMPRILRRGMAYGRASDEGALGSDRGTLFMAYCASIAEQFEIIQRWVSGGNSSGVSSLQSDPLLGVPREGEPRVYRWIDAKGMPARADLGADAFVELQWGLYLFVPSLAALERLGDFRIASASTAVTPPSPPSALEIWQGMLEDRDNGRATWKSVREQPGGEMNVPEYGRLVGTADGVFAALADADCVRVSVRGFGQRMSVSIGLNHLGMDPADGYTAVGEAINPVVASVDEESAFEAAAPIALAVLTVFNRLSDGRFGLRHPDGRTRVPVDLMSFSEQVVGQLAKKWFGLPDGIHMTSGGRLPTPDTDGAARCPGHIIGPSRMIFSTHPNVRVDAEGGLLGPKVLRAVTDALAAGLPAGAGELTDALRTTLAPLEGAYGSGLLDREVAGLLLGFAPTVHGNFLTVMRNWIEGDSLWSLQEELTERMRDGLSPFEAARAALLRPMLDTMQLEPVPPTVWRSPVVDGTPDPSQSPVVLGLSSAIDGLDPIAHRAQRDALLFGGDYFAAAGAAERTVHACPGSKMGQGVMLAMTAALLNAGTLRPTGSPVLLMLTPKSP